jgi:hypothetical protein
MEHIYEHLMAARLTTDDIFHRPGRSAAGDLARHEFKQALEGAGMPRARLHCRFVLPLILFIPDSLTYSVPLFLKQQCDRAPGLELLPSELRPVAEALDRRGDGAVSLEGFRSGMREAKRRIAEGAVPEPLQAASPRNRPTWAAARAEGAAASAGRRPARPEGSDGGDSADEGDRSHDEGELAGLKLSALRKRAAEVGVHAERLEAALDSDDQKGELIALIMRCSSEQREQRGQRGRRQPDDSADEAGERRLHAELLEEERRAAAALLEEKKERRAAEARLEEERRAAEAKAMWEAGMLTQGGQGGPLGLMLSWDSYALPVAFAWDQPGATHRCPPPPPG